MADRDDIPALMQRLQRRDRAALSRLLSLAIARPDAVDEALPENAVDGPPVIAVTGSGGVGKSSLLGALTSRLAAHGAQIGVLACDPESPVSGGALLGDRCRIANTATGDRIFLRSLSTASGQQAIAEHIRLMLRVMKCFSFDWIFIETVGAGQGDTAVRLIADLVILVAQPQTGDELQWEKAGILEVADLVVVNKADLPGAERTVADISSQLQPKLGKTVPVVMTSIARDEGLGELQQTIDQAVLELGA